MQVVDALQQALEHIGVSYLKKRARFAFKTTEDFVVSVPVVELMKAVVKLEGYVTCICARAFAYAHVFVGLQERLHEIRLSEVQFREGTSSTKYEFSTSRKADWAAARVATHVSVAETALSFSLAAAFKANKVRSILAFFVSLY